MNERIKQLAEQAGIKITTLTDNGVEYDYEEVDMDGSEDLQKFAELIVRECAGIYSKIDNGNQHMGTDNYLEALQKHFGVG